MFHPTPSTLKALQRIAPRLVDVVRLKNVGHWPQHEAAGRVNAELVRFLGTIGLPKEPDAVGSNG